MSSCRASWLLSCLSLRCPLVLSSRCHLVFLPHLSSSSSCTALSLSHCAGWLLLHRLSSRRRLVLSLRRTLILLSSSHCAALSSSNRTGWLLRRLSLRRRLVLSSSSYYASLSSSTRAGVASPLVAPPSRLLIAPRYCPLVVLSLRRLVVVSPLVAPSSRPLVLLLLRATISSSCAGSFLYCLSLCRCLVLLLCCPLILSLRAG